MGRIWLALIVAVILALVSCSPSTPTPAPSPSPTPTIPSKQSPTPTPTQTPTPTSTPVPTLKITAPTGTRFAIGNVTVEVQVANFKLVDNLGKASVAGEGHIHYFLDVTPPTEAGKPAVTAAGTYAATAATSYTWAGVAAGTHTFSVELVNNDHTPLTPPVVAKVTVTVGSPPPTPTPSPTSSPGVPSVTLNISAQNFAFDKSILSVHMGTDVTLVFDNKDSAPHNVAIYTNSSATTVIFQGATFTGPGVMSYQFKSPAAPGTYYFRCDVHPTMNGSFVVVQ